MFDVVTNTLALVFVLGVLVFVHELGHFLLAKYFGVGVEVFSLGFGKRLFGFRKNDTDYCVSVLPLGGYVKMVGENPDEALTGSDNEYLNKPKWQRFLILVAGPMMNIALAFVFTVGVYQLGIRVQADSDQPVVVGLVQADTPAEAAGLRAGDRVVSVNDEPMVDWEQFRVRILIAAGEQLELGVVRDGTEIRVPVTPVASEEQATGYLGIASVQPAEVGVLEPGGAAEQAGIRVGDLITAVAGEPVDHWNTLVDKVLARAGEVLPLTVQRGTEQLQIDLPSTLNDDGQLMLGFTLDPERVVKVRSYPLGEAMVQAGRELKRQSLLLGEILKRLFTGRMSVRTLSGPIEIARFSGGAARTGDPSVLLSFMAFISLQLGILNLLPIPVLDGGQIALILFEGAIRRDLSLQVKERIMQVGLVILVSLMAVVITLDVSKIIPASWWDLLPF